MDKLKYYCIYRTMLVNVLICLIILTSQCVHSKVININNDNGTNSTECCVNGKCVCSSLYTVLVNIASNTMINIISESVALSNTTTMGSGNLTNITITGSNVTIMCNNSGSVYCESCDNVKIEGITWDSCGDPNGILAGVTFNITRNFSLVNCTFQHSQMSAVSLLEVSDNILIQGCIFLSNYHALNIARDPHIFTTVSNITITINESYFRNNGYTIGESAYNQRSLSIRINGTLVVNCNINFVKTKFMSNRNAAYISVAIYGKINILLKEILVFNSSLFANYGSGLTIYPGTFIGDIVLSVVSSKFSHNEGSSLWCWAVGGNRILATINNSNFSDTRPPFYAYLGMSAIEIFPHAKNISEIMFYRVQFNDNLIGVPKFTYLKDTAAAVNIITLRGKVKINLTMVNFTSNQYTGYDGGALFIYLSYRDENTVSGFYDIHLENCKFLSNVSPGHGAALYIYSEDFGTSSVDIIDTRFDQNIASSSIVYIEQLGRDSEVNYIQVQLNSSTFTNNVANSVYLSSCDVTLSGVILFKNNTAENGGAMYINQGTRVKIRNEAIIQFIANTAMMNGGAIYVDFLCNKDATNIFYYDNPSMKFSGVFMFINNSATFVGNSLYFNIPRSCPINKNINDSDSILHVPCQFNYSQPVNGRMMQHIPCDLDYTLFSGTGVPIVTSPHELRLYFPYNEGYNISNSSDYNVYFVKSSSFGQLKFAGSVFDLFGKPTQPMTFSVKSQCSNNSGCSTYSISVINSNLLQYQTVNNFTHLSIDFSGERIKTKSINVTIMLISALSYSYIASNINASLVVELLPCNEHPGHTYSEDLHTCVCYNVNVKCSSDVNEIKRGYWFGSIVGEATTSLCPNHYCKFTDRKQTSEGYFELPNTINAQCSHHRVGRACGECSSGYTLSYDSTDCISVHQCGAGWTVLVIVLTCLYWIAVVVGVFICFSFQISLGHLYGIIYYYSIVNVLLDNNPYISDGAFQFVSILSSFAQLTPQFLGKLCFIKCLSGIDQLFIHYSHAVAVSLLLLSIVITARYSNRITLFVSRRIIRVICLLILLAYTSIASTSLQLLLPLKFTDIKDRYTYSSPHIQYFHGRHAVYGAVAIICEAIVGIGLPMLLLLEPLLRRKINFIRIKPLLDQFQGCYKDKYHWFPAYYLICRHVIFLIVYGQAFNENYNNMLFYLQAACVVIAFIHILIWPYKNEVLNQLDAIMLFLMVLLSNGDFFPFPEDVAKDVIILVKVMFPLILISMFTIKNVLHSCVKKKHHDYMPINPVNGERAVAEENNIRYK